MQMPNGFCPNVRVNGRAMLRATCKSGSAFDSVTRSRRLRIDGGQTSNDQLPIANHSQRPTVNELSLGIGHWEWLGVGRWQLGVCVSAALTRCSAWRRGIADRQE